MGNQGGSSDPFVSLSLCLSVSLIFFSYCLCPPIFLSFNLYLLASVGLPQHMRVLISASPAYLLLPLSPSLQTSQNMVGLLMTLTHLVPILTNPVSRCSIPNPQGGHNNWLSLWSASYGLASSLSCGSARAPVWGESGARLAPGNSSGCESSQIKDKPWGHTSKKFFPVTNPTERGAPGNPWGRPPM